MVNSRVDPDFHDNRNAGICCSEIREEILRVGVVRLLLYAIVLVETKLGQDTRERDLCGHRSERLHGWTDAIGEHRQWGRSHSQILKT